MANKNLHKAKSAKNDEFYTQLSDIENELRHYKQHFKDKVVFLNCDDPRESNFYVYFAQNFDHLGLKKLIATHYKADEPTYKLEITRDENGDGKINALDTVETKLKQNGDFRSDEAIAILKEVDIVVTNPPFSLFREYIAQLMEYDKKFLIVGNPNAITYKETFKLIKDNKLWIGNKSMGTDMLFDVPKEFAKELVETKKEGSAYRIINGVVKGRAQAIWFTNLDHNKRHEEIVLYKTYNEEEYPKYDNYDAINVDKVADIPVYYDGVMGVPITFLGKYNPKQFEIVDMSTMSGVSANHWTYIGGKPKYARIYIKRK